MLRLAERNLVIGVTAGEGRSRLALNSSSLIEEGLKNVLSQSPDILGERNLSQDYILVLSSQKIRSVFTVDCES